MSDTTVVNIRNSAYDVYIGRGGTYRLPTGWTLFEPSPWGNPFHVTRATPRERAIAKYERWIREQPELMARLPELRGKRLGCFCAPMECHGDVLARLANALPAEAK